MLTLHLVDLINKTNKVVTVTSIINTDKTQLAKDLPGVSFIRNCRSLLVVITKTLAAHHLAKLDSFDQLCTDGTDRRQTEFENVVVGYMADNGYKSVILDATIVPGGKTAEHLNDAIIRTLKEASDLLDDWRAVIAEMFKDDPT